MRYTKLTCRQAIQKKVEKINGRRPQTLKKQNLVLILILISVKFNVAFLTIKYNNIIGSNLMSKKKTLKTFFKVLVKRMKFQGKFKDYSGIECTDFHPNNSRRERTSSLEKI